MRWAAGVSLAFACTGCASGVPEVKAPATQGATRPNILRGAIDPKATLLRPEGHLARVTCLSFSPDGRLLVSGSEDATLLVWDVASSHVVQRLQGHSGFVAGCAFLPNGRQVVSGGAAGEVFVWDLGTGEKRVIGSLEAWDHVYSLAVRPDGQEVLVGTVYGGVRAWDLASSRETFRSDDLGCIATGCEVLTVGHWPDGGRFAGSPARGARVWDRVGSLVRQVGGLVVVSGVALPGGSLLLGSNAEVLESRADGSRRFLGKLSANVYGLAVSPRGDLVLAGDAFGAAKVWSATAGERRCELPSLPAIAAATFDRKGHLFAIAGHDGAIRIGRVDQCTPGKTPALKSWQAARGRVLAVAAEKAVFVGDGAGQVGTWEPSAWEQRKVTPAHRGEVSALAALPDGSWVSGGMDAVVTQEGRVLGRLSSTPSDIVVAQDGLSALLVDVKGKWTSFLLQGGTTSEMVDTDLPLYAVAVRPASHEVIVGGAPDWLFRVALGQGALASWPRAKPAPDSTMALAYSRHGAWLAEGTALGHVVLRDAESGAIQGEFTGLSGQVFGLQFARDQLWASDHLGHLRRWPLKGGPLSDRVFDEPTGLGRLASTADSHFLIEAMRDGRARVRGLPDGEHVADLIQMRDGSWATWFADGTTQYSATGEVRRALFALPDRRVVQLDGTQPRLEFGETSVTRVALGAFAVRTTVFSAFGAPSLRLDGRWAIASIRPSPTVALAYDVEFFVDDPLGGSHALEATSEALGSASTTFTLGADLRKTRALVIGNEDYAASSHGVPDVPGAGSDAEAIASLFRSPTGWAMGKDQLQVLKSLPAAELRAKVTGFFKAAQRGETLLFYFAGHGLTQTRPGGKEGLLLPVDFDPAHPETGFSATELWAAIRASSAANVLLVFDACRSGAFALPADLLGAEVEAGRTSGQGPAVGLLAATHAGGSAQGTTTGGVFTQTLVQVLQSPGSVDVFSGVHTVGGAFTRLRGVPAAAAQWPRLFGSLDDLLLARPERPVESTRTTTETLAADRWLQKATFTVNELRQISVAGHRVDARADKDRNLIVKLFFGHDTDSVKISIRYPDPDPQKTLRTEGVATGGKAATEREVGILLKKDVFTTTGEHTVTVQPCRTKEQCGEEPAVTFKVTL